MSRDGFCDTSGKTTYYILHCASLLRLCFGAKASRSLFLERDIASIDVWICYLCIFLLSLVLVPIAIAIMSWERTLKPATAAPIRFILTCDCNYNS